MAARPAPSARKAGQTNTGPPLFDGLRYFIASCVPIKEQVGMRALLASNGATEVKLAKEAEYIFTDSETFEGVGEVRKTTALVLPKWIERSLANKTRQEPRYFSPSSSAIFSTLVIATDHLPPGDVDTIIAGTYARGGMYREGLTRDVTHLLVLSPTGDKYRTARRHAAQTGIKIVLVHWFDDCFKVEHRLPERPYEEALLQAEREIRKEANGEEMLQSDVPIKRKKMKLPDRAKSFYDALHMASTPPQQNSPVKAIGSVKPHVDVWKARRILLSHSLMLSKDRRTTVITEIERCGGLVVFADKKETLVVVESSQADDEHNAINAHEVDELDSDVELEEDVQFEVEFAKADEEGKRKGGMKLSARYRAADLREAMFVMEGQVDVLVTKYRSGLAYLAALHGAGKNHKEVAVATLPWVFYVQDLGAFSAPTNQLLHFPVRRGSVKDIKGKTITISNYQGLARDYLKKLINVMGGPRGPGVPEIFTATLSKQTNVVIAARIEGKKVESAQAWKIPIVNHLWLEDTFKAWQGASLADPRYTHWRSKISFNDLLPGCPVFEGNMAELKEDADQVVEEMKLIGYDEGLIKSALTCNLDALRDAETAPRRRVAATEEPTSSYAEVERTLHIGDAHMDVDEESIIQETSSSRKTERSSDKPSSKVDSLAAFKPPSGKRLVPVVSRLREDLGSREATVSAILGNSGKGSQVLVALSQKNPPAAESMPPPIPQAPKSIPTAVAPVLRSPWDPSPTKKPILSRVVNDSPAEFRRPAKKKPTKTEKEPRRLVKVPAAVADHSDASMDDAEATLKPSRKVKSRAQDPIPAPPDEGDGSESGGGALSDRHHHPKTKKEEKKPQSAGRGKKRNIQTQESDEEFRVETQDDLISRHRKVVSADRSHGMEVSPRAGPSHSRRSTRKEEKEESSNSEDEYMHDGTEKRNVSAKADKAIRRLRDSISGKEGAITNKGGTTKAANRRQASPSEDEDSPIEQPAKSERKPRNGKKANHKPRAVPIIKDTSSLTPAPSDNEDPGRPSPSTSVVSKQTSSASKSVSSEDNDAPRARRGAATKATQLLRDKIMPDANRFAQQMKTGDIRNDWEENKKRRRESAMDDTDGTADTKRRRKSEGVVGDVKKRETGAVVLHTGIRMLTTKVPLREDELQKLHSMGILHVEDPLSCTHLVSNAILRTEKFLCALSTSPIIVTEKWVRECLRTKKVVDTTPYVLQDEDGERKFKFELEECLARARETGRTLLSGHFFYLIFTTEAADNVIRTLASAIKSAGGTCARQLPSLRQVEDHQDDRHVISDINGQSKWRPLAEKGIPIYNQEVILTAILQQEVPNWNNPEFLLS